MNSQNQAYKAKLQQFESIECGKDIDIMPLYIIAEEIMGNEVTHSQSVSFEELLNTLELAKSRHQRLQSLIDSLTGENKRLKEEINSNRNEIRN